MPNPDFKTMRSKVVEGIVQLARNKYVYPDRGERIADQLQAKLEAGEYDDLTEESELAIRLTVDLRAISNDRHWAVQYDPEGSPEQIDPETETNENRLNGYLRQARKLNFGFERVERLNGNIGYIDLRKCEPSQFAGDTACAAMNFVANCEAVIFDLRNNHGGYPTMVQLLISYLVSPNPQWINTFYYRAQDQTQQFWTLPYVPGKRLPEALVYVLTSSETASGAEEFAYDLKQMKRATLVGETTAGAAHFVCREIVEDVFAVNLPYGRPINPISEDDWEIKGVPPDIAASAEEALKVAHLQALEGLLARCQDEGYKKALAWEKEIVEGNYAPPTISEADLARCTGEYGKRQFFLREAELYYRIPEFTDGWKLTPMTKSSFRLDEDLKIEFIFGNGGKAQGVKIRYRDGRPEVIAHRTE